MNAALMDRLTQRLQAPLPGLAAQLELTSRTRGMKWEVRPDHRKSGVLALFYPNHEQLHIVFMKRTDDGKVHGGQVSFPGGKVEPDDPDPAFTALREAKEELGIQPESVSIIGSLTPLYIPPSNFMVYPSVGFTPERPHFVPQSTEVAAVIEADLNTLLRPETRRKEKIRVRQEFAMEVPAFVVDNHVIWGATAMMLNELLTLVGEIR